MEQTSHCEQANVARQVAEAFGGVAELTGALGSCPFSTVYSWMRTGRIPAWRRPGIVLAAASKGISLPPSFVAADL